MPWARRRRALYILGILLFFTAVIGIPLAYFYFSKPATCHDGLQNGGESGVDVGGPCNALDSRYLQPHAVLWSRSFKVRDGTYNSVAYVQNPNKDAGTVALYIFRLYDSGNILIAERDGAASIMPGGVTPIFVSKIDTGNRIVAHTYFEFIGSPRWFRVQNTALAVSVANKTVSDTASTPRISADVLNSSVEDIVNPTFIAVVFDTAGNAFAASETALDRLKANASSHIVFTWPDPFLVSIGRIDITPVTTPVPKTQ